MCVCVCVSQNPPYVLSAAVKRANYLLRFAEKILKRKTKNNFFSSNLSLEAEYSLALACYQGNQVKYVFVQFSI